MQKFKPWSAATMPIVVKLCHRNLIDFNPARRLSPYIVALKLSIGPSNTTSYLSRRLKSGPRVTRKQVPRKYMRVGSTNGVHLPHAPCDNPHERHAIIFTAGQLWRP